MHGVEREKTEANKIVPGMRQTLVAIFDNSFVQDHPR